MYTLFESHMKPIYMNTKNANLALDFFLFFIVLFVIDPYLWKHLNIWIKQSSYCW